MPRILQRLHQGQGQDQVAQLVIADDQDAALQKAFFTLAISEVVL